MRNGSVAEHNSAAGTSPSDIRVLIVADNCSLRFSGEAALPCHYFRVLRSRGVDVWLVTHGRNQRELESIFPGDSDRMRFVRDDVFHQALHALGRPLPNRVDRATFRFLSQMYTQLLQRRLIWQLLRQEKIDVIHQPTPVSPAEPSLIVGFGVPVIIGPMNGGMDFPPGFRHREDPFERFFVRCGRLLSNFMNHVLPGKRRARALLVANQRTRTYLPAAMQPQAIEIVENGVDLSMWTVSRRRRGRSRMRFVYMGRLLDWKGLDLLLRAWALVHRSIRAELQIIGNGPKLDALRLLAEQLEIADQVSFTGWLTQEQCARHLSEADVLVLPSLIECGGAVVLEAMAAGIPVIATKWGGAVDYLDPSCGVLVEPHSEESFIAGLAAAMRRLHDNPDLARAMGKAGRQKAVEEFDWERKVDQVMKVYRWACARGASSSQAVAAAETADHPAAAAAGGNGRQWRSGGGRQPVLGTTHVQ